MATSTIFANVKISDPEQAKAFIDAMEKSAQEPVRKPSAPVGPYLKDKDTIRALFANKERKAQV